VAGHECSVRMRRIDQHIDVLGGKIVGEPLRAAEAADAKLNRDSRRRTSATGERQRHSDPDMRGKPLRQLTRFRRAAQNEDAHAS